MADRSSDDLSPHSRRAALYKLLFETALSLANLKPFEERPLAADLRMPNEQQSPLQRRHESREAVQGLGDRWQQPTAVQRTQR